VEVAERKRAEELATRQAERLSEQAALLDLAQDAISVSSLDGTITFWNRGAELSYGWAREEALGKKVHELLQTQFQVPAAEIMRTLMSEGQWIGDIRHTTRHGAVVMCASRWVLRMQNGQPSGWLQIDRDVTETRRLQELLAERRKLESLSVLAGGVAHDFNNLLTGILGNINMARAMTDEGQPIHGLLARSEAACQRAADLIQKILAYTGKGQFTVEAVDLSQVVREMAVLLRNSIRDEIAIHLVLADGLPPIWCDGTQLKQVAMDLMLNAAESIRGAGKILVRTRMAEIGAADQEEPWDVGEPKPGRYTALEVQDTGCGVDPVIRGKIFEPFFTTKFVGRGLGLAAVAGIVRSLNGAARISSKPGQGTTVTVLLPVEGGEQAH
jgi:PAS domain S-box-containing protein